MTSVEWAAVKVDDFVPAQKAVLLVVERAASRELHVVDGPVDAVGASDGDRGRGRVHC